MSENKTFDTVLRPKEWSEYIGQDQIKKLLRVSIDAAKKRKENLDHLLLYGPPGLGKTTLANILATEMSMEIQTTSGPVLEKAGDIVAILSSFEKPSILFIDEIHRIPKSIEETLYPIMEAGVLDIMIGKGVSARSVNLSFAPCTIIGATTKAGMLSKPLLSRFSGGTLRLNQYTNKEIETIVTQSAKKLNIEIKNDAVQLLAERSRNTPRTANNLLKRSRDVAQVQETTITKDVALEAMNLCQVDEIGLSEQDYEYLTTLHHSFKGGPIGVAPLAAALNEQEITLEEYIEPFLIQINFIQRTPRGRTITQKAKEYLKEKDVLV